jgi:hypothetical protein
MTSTHPAMGLEAARSAPNANRIARYRSAEAMLGQCRLVAQRHRATQAPRSSGSEGGADAPRPDTTGSHDLQRNCLSYDCSLARRRCAYLREAEPSRRSKKSATVSCHHHRLYYRAERWFAFTVR